MKGSNAVGNQRRAWTAKPERFIACFFTRSLRVNAKDLNAHPIFGTLTFRAFSTEADAGSAKEMRQVKNLERLKKRTSVVSFHRTTTLHSIQSGHGGNFVSALLKFFGRSSSGLRVDNIDDAKIERLFSLLEKVPTARAEINSWTSEVSILLKELILQRISNDDLAAILSGLLSYRKNGVSSENTQFALIRAFCATSGVSHEVLHRILFGAKIGDGDELQESQFFGRIDKDSRASILKALSETGYAVLPVRLSKEAVAQLNAAALTMNYNLRSDVERLGAVSTIDPEHPPSCVVADAFEADVLANPLFHALAHDPQIIGLIEAHLGSRVSPYVALRYTFPSNAASDDCAQMYHYDLDTLRWLKVFYYLNDVGPDNGPHVYVEGSHRFGAKAPTLLGREYARISDEDIETLQPGAIRSIEGPAGTVVLGDTRAYHKGLNVKAGHRLLFFPLYAPSTFGLDHGV